MLSYAYFYSIAAPAGMPWLDIGLKNIDIDKIIICIAYMYKH